MPRVTQVDTATGEATVLVEDGKPSTVSGVLVMCGHGQHVRPIPVVTK